MELTHFRFKEFTKTVGILLFSLGAAASAAVPAAADGSQTCNGALQTGPAVGRWELRLGPGRASTRAVTLPGNQSVLLVAHEDQVDVDIDVSSPTHAAAQAGNPVRRNGVLHVLLRTDSSGLATISVRATADGGLGSRVTIQAYNNEAPPAQCLPVGRGGTGCRRRGLRSGATDICRAGWTERGLRDGSLRHRLSELRACVCRPCAGK